MTIRIVHSGMLTSVQDRGRPHLGTLGIPCAGTVVRTAANMVNAAVGNPDTAAVIETQGGLVIEATYPTVVATSTTGQRTTLDEGARLAIGPRSGFRWAYLAVRGGFDVEPVLGSRSRDDQCGVGPLPLLDGVRLPVGTDHTHEPPTSLAPPALRSDVIRLWKGPRLDIVPGGLSALTGQAWTVGDADRARIHLAGFASLIIDPHVPRPAEPLIEGAVCLTPSGSLTIMLSNHPTSGPDPAIAVIEPSDLSAIAQAPSEATLRFCTM